VTNDFEYAELRLRADALYAALLSVQSIYAGWHPDRAAADAALASYEENVR
jgi:hypothetical protein